MTAALIVLCVWLYLAGCLMLYATNKNDGTLFGGFGRLAR